MGKSNPAATTPYCCCQQWLQTYAERGCVAVATTTGGFYGDVASLNFSYCLSTLILLHVMSYKVFNLFFMLCACDLISKFINIHQSLYDL